MARKPTKLPATTPGEAVALALPNVMAWDEYLALGRDLAGKKHSIDWMIGDWLTYGREHFPEQIQAELPGIFDDERLVRRIEKTVKAFPPALRDPKLSFDHHAHVADMPQEDALPLLKLASTDRINARRFRLVAMDAKVEKGHLLPREDDAEDDEILKLIRSWNRASKAVRREFADMLEDAGDGLIDPTGKVK